MGGGLKEGQKVTLIVQMKGKNSKDAVKKFKDAVKKAAKDNGASVTEV
jgi:phosphotransferase system HPr-like phosphotransfer protein